VTALDQEVQQTSQNRERRGIVYGLAAYALWGIVPLFWPLVSRATALELLAQRVIWSLVVAVVLLLTTVPRGWWAKIRSTRNLLMLALAAAVISVNWGLYIWGVNHGHVVETALGYYINPILSILLGVVLLKERLSKLQWAAVGLAALAVVVLTIDYGQPPWIALTLAVSFATYGFLKKKVNGGAVETLTIESAFLLLPALAYLTYLQATGQLTFWHLGLGHSLLIMCTGLITAVPLLFFAAASTRVPLSTLGLIQYVAPTAQFLLGVWYFHEDMSPARWIGFACVWVALMLLTGFGIAQSASQRRAARAVPEPV
jgi:chloramphenicol-sensitive protein RarD